MQALCYLGRITALLGILAAGGVWADGKSQQSESAWLLGGETSVSRFDRDAFSQPAANLPISRKLDFSVGNSFFRNPWVIAPASTAARDGLGPLFNTNGCQNCHIKDGRGHPPEANDVHAVSMLVRLSIENSEALASRTPAQGVIAEPTYGGQLQDFANPGVQPEGRIAIRYDDKPVELADGTVITLRQPILEIKALAYGALHPDTAFSARVAPPMIGLGLLEAIAEADILHYEDPDDSNHDGISGRANRVWSVEAQQLALGRFGWKAGQPSLRQQNAGAFAGDMGLTTSQFMADDCTPAQTACRQQPHGGEPEVSDDILAAVTFYTRHLAVPKRRDAETPAVVRGEDLFHQVGCAQCHRPSYVTANHEDRPELSQQRIFPYTDLLLHDMGPGLADARTDFLANGQEWRTPPLWGIGLTDTVNGHTYFLHDGRARNLLEAILWHGGEAQASRDKVVGMNAAEREALLAFLNSL